MRKVVSWLPTIAFMDDPKDKAEYLTRLFSEIYITDIVEREKVHNTRCPILVPSRGSWT